MKYLIAVEMVSEDMKLHFDRSIPEKLLEKICLHLAEDFDLEEHLEPKESSCCGVDTWGITLEENSVISFVGFPE